MTTPPPPHGLLRGKRVVVTASAGAGIGFATARRCAEEGARVVVSDIHERRLDEAARQIEQLVGERPPTVVCDVTSEDDVRRLYETAAGVLGGIDVAINNAGLGATSNVVDMPDDEWQRVLDVSLTGTMRCTRAVLRYMIPQRSGVIVNLSSVLAWRAQAGQSHYAAAKAGVAAFTRCVAMEVAPYGIRVNAVAPSLAMHPFLEKVMPKETLDGLVELEAFKRSAETWEIANVIVFLSSDYASYMTGEVLSVSSQHP